MTQNGLVNYDSILLRKGYILVKKIENTLQGCIYIARHNDTNSKVVIKIASIKIQNMVTFNENIIKEAQIMKYLSKNQPPKGFIGYIDFFKDDNFQYLVMEYGGVSLHKYIKYHTLKMRSNKLDIKSWKTHVRKLFKQICLYVNWMHSNNVCHLDISLENFTIKGFEYDNETNTIINHGNVYIIDFGLSEYFGKNSDFMCNKKCGKVRYQSNKVYYGKKYNAKKVDIWALGVVLFMMILAVFPYEKPTNNDIFYCNIMRGHLGSMIKTQNKHKYIINYDNFIHLMNGIFCTENKRYSIKDIINHPYISQKKS